ncbi:hypothetical protein AC579_5617 [Pseudocercospora musae]|uniref:Uncharacterized protein n=1 Tax=Pseudocercospora musae TaxID=113226 RepID=A0A139I1H4_9PEZI|nr:hypothetical protein AC579_5617 [Pseudocercospora musae]
MPASNPPTSVHPPHICIPNALAEVVEYKNACWQAARKCSTDALALTDAPVIIIFISTTHADNTPSNTKTHTALATKLSIPTFFWQAKVQNASGYFYARHHATPADPHYMTLTHFLIKYATGVDQESGLDKAYDWHKQSFLTLHNPRKQTTTLICVDVAPPLHTHILQLVQARPVPELTSHPFVIHGSILEHILTLYDNAIWDFRNFVRAQEQERPTIQHPHPDYIAMHELARHVMHSSEVSETALDVIDSMLEELERYQKKHHHHHHPQPPHTNHLDPASEIRRHRSLLKAIHLRSRALHERLRNEINLAFHISTQADSLVQQKIATLSRRDSNATRTISILGLVFLPGTFISAIFSMSFFNYQQPSNHSPASWAMSEKFWIYWVVAIPVTLITIGVWWYWQQQQQETPNHNNNNNVDESPASKKKNFSLPLRSHTVPIDPKETKTFPCY